MQHVLVAFYAFVLSFGHPAPQHHAEAMFSPEPARVHFAPSHEELLRSSLEASSYAETACVSCRVTNVSYPAR